MVLLTSPFEIFFLRDAGLSGVLESELALMKPNSRMNWMAWKRGQLIYRQPLQLLKIQV